MTKSSTAAAESPSAKSRVSIGRDSLRQVALALDEGGRIEDDHVELLPRRAQRRQRIECVVAHREFHRALYLASHNDMLIKLLDDLWDKSDRYRRLGLELPAGEEPRTIDLNEHHQILDSFEGVRAAEFTS